MPLLHTPTPYLISVVAQCMTESLQRNYVVAPPADVTGPVRKQLAEFAHLESPHMAHQAFVVGCHGLCERPTPSFRDVHIPRHIQARQHRAGFEQSGKMCDALVRDFIGRQPGVITSAVRVQHAQAAS